MLSKEAKRELKRLAKSKKLREDFELLRRFEEEAAKQPGYEKRRRNMNEWLWKMHLQNRVLLGLPPLPKDTPMPPLPPLAKTARKPKRSH